MDEKIRPTWRRPPPMWSVPMGGVVSQEAATPICVGGVDESTTNLAAGTEAPKTITAAQIAAARQLARITISAEKD